jgi:hypothetical protein
MKSFNLYSKSSYKQHIFNLIQKFHDEVQSNKNIVNFAPPKEILSCFGGTMDIQSFRKNNEKYAVYDYPMKSEERIIERYENFSIAQQEHQNTEVIQNEPIKLKRKTPKVSAQNTLEKSMGVFKS